MQCLLSSPPRRFALFVEPQQRKPFQGRPLAVSAIASIRPWHSLDAWMSQVYMARLMRGDQSSMPALQVSRTVEIKAPTTADIFNRAVCQHLSSEGQHKTHPAQIPPRRVCTRDSRRSKPFPPPARSTAGLGTRPSGTQTRHYSPDLSAVATPSWQRRCPPR